MKYEVRGYCAKPHAAGRFLPFGSSMQEEGRFMATKPRSGTRGERFPSDFDACGGFSQRNPRSPTDRRERADGFRARTRFRGQKREVSQHRRASGRARRWDGRAAARRAPSTCALRDARGVGDGGLARRRSATAGRGRAQRQVRHREPDRARHRSVAVSPPDVTLCDSIPVPMSRFHPDATLRPDIALYEDCVNYLRVTKGTRQRIVNSWLQYPDVSRR